tara:strand:- start:2091 stop:2645 length:555 start_codon:yes stop_codon:yes gene_type:complete
MSIKRKSIDHLIGIEGGYVNDSRDSGGETNYGITIGTARAFGYDGPMKNMSRNEAYNIYSLLYWDPLRLDQIERLSELVAYELFDTGVNMGLHRSATFLQTSLNALNKSQSLYDDLVVDGRIGAKSISALKAYLDKRGKSGELVLVRMLNCLQGAFYIELAERRPKDKAFVYGWFLNRITIEGE